MASPASSSISSVLSRYCRTTSAFCTSTNTTTTSSANREKANHKIRLRLVPVPSRLFLPARTIPPSGSSQNLRLELIAKSPQRHDEFAVFLQVTPQHLDMGIYRP